MDKQSIDIQESTLARRTPLLDILLLDRTRTTEKKSHNILWATESYLKLGKDFSPKKEIKPEQITGKNGNLIQPRAAKSKEEQAERVKAKAEVFTPLDIVDEMNRAVERARAENLSENHSWQDYIKELKLEITCGEAPFIVSRYNPTANTGKLKKLENRVGFLDRKLQIVSKNCSDKSEWLKWAKIAYQSSYGYEWQGDNLLLARENIFMSFVDYYNAKFPDDKIALNRPPSAEKMEILKEIAEIVSWNIWQMDGLKFVVPMSCKHIVEEINDTPLLASLEGFEPELRKNECEGCKFKDRPKTHNGKYAKIMNWQTEKPEKFVSSLTS